MVLIVESICMCLGFGKIFGSAEAEEFATVAVIAVDAKIKWLYDY